MKYYVELKPLTKKESKWLTKHCGAKYVPDPKKYFWARRPDGIFISVPFTDVITEHD